MRSVLSPFQGPLKIKGTKESPNPSSPVTIWSQSPEGRVNSPAHSWVRRRGQEEVQPQPRLPLQQRSPRVRRRRSGQGRPCGSAGRGWLWAGLLEGWGEAGELGGPAEWAGLSSWRGGSRRVGGASAPVCKSRSCGEPAEPRRPNPHRGGARAGRATPGSLCGRCPTVAESASGRSAERGGALLRPPPPSPSPGEECVTSCSLASAAPRSKKLGGRETKAAVGTDELETWVWANKRCERREGVKAMAAGEPRGLGFLGVAP